MAPITADEFTAVVRRIFRASALTLGVLAAPIAIPAVSATTINGITLTDQNIFHDFRGINDVGIGQGDLLQFGGNIGGGSAGAFGAGVFTPTGSTTPTITQTLTPCGPLAVNQNFCARTTAFTSQKLDGTWQFEVQQGANVATFSLPSAAVIPTTAVPFPTSVRITNSLNGIQPTINWTLPAGFTPDAFRINIFDRSAPPLANGQDNIIHSVSISPTATSYTFPAVLGSGQSLIVGHQYSINFQIIETRDGGPNTSNGNADILTRSNSFFDFTPQPGLLTPSNIALPMVNGVTGVYQFNVGTVGRDFITFIDPPVAVGYVYDIGASDPNFASVLLPNVGDGVFELSFLSTQVEVNAGTQFFFPAGGVSEFEVTGIEASAHLDPADTSAFVTGLTFVSTGSFTGTMTPITEEVSAAPQPKSLALFGVGLLGFPLIRRRLATMFSGLARATL